MDSDPQSKVEDPVTGGQVSGDSLLYHGVLVVSFVVAYLPVWKRLIDSWSQSGEYSHGFLIVPVCLYIAWRKREVLRCIRLEPSKWGLAVFFLSLAIYAFSMLAEIRTAASLSMVLVLLGSIAYLYGASFVRRLAFPAFLFLFMIPVPAQIYAEVTIPLQLLVSKVSAWTAGQLGLPVYREGNVIHLPGLTLEVVQACSGLRSMVSLLLLGAVFGYFSIRSNMLRIVLFVSAIPISIVVNTFRVLVLILGWNWLNRDLSEGTGHTLSGIMVFGFALFLVVLVREILVRWDIRSKEE
jgi:exosortase